MRTGVLSSCFQDTHFVWAELVVTSIKDRDDRKRLRPSLATDLAFTTAGRTIRFAQGQRSASVIGVEKTRRTPPLAREQIVLGSIGNVPSSSAVQMLTSSPHEDRALHIVNVIDRLGARSAVDTH